MGGYYADVVQKNDVSMQNLLEYYESQFEEWHGELRYS